MASRSFLSMVEAELPPGFRFHPRDDELVCDYLAPKIAAAAAGFSGRRPPMVDVDLNKVEPWDLPAAASVGEREWYFFSLRDRKYATGQRTNRATLSGYWKATGKDRLVARRGALVGMRKTLVFYRGRAPKGRKTEWVMHEYRMDGAHEPPKLPSKEDWVLCRVLCKKKPAAAGGGGHGAATSKPRHLTATSPPPLPPLMDTAAAAALAMDATLLEQVPCFSSFMTRTDAAYHPMAAATTGGAAAAAAMDGPEAGHGVTGLAAYLDPLSCDKKVLRAVLSHFSKLEGTNSSPMAMGGVVPSLAPEVAVNSPWVSSPFLGAFN